MSKFIGHKWMIETDTAPFYRCILYAKDGSVLLGFELSPEDGSTIVKWLYLMKKGIENE